MKRKTMALLLGTHLLVAAAGFAGAVPAAGVTASEAAPCSLPKGSES